MKEKIKHIAVAGNIGSGKTTLSGLLSQHYDWTPFYEDVDDNPYLNDFYQSQPRWSFNLQIYFLNKRLQDLLNIAESGKAVIQDRTIYEDAHIFAPCLHEMGLMSKRDFENYFSLYKTVKRFITPPDLLIYLRATIPTLVNQIQKRGRDYEDNIRLDYLKHLNQYYNNWIDNYHEGPLLIIDVDNINFADSKEDLGKVIERVNGELFGLF